MPAERRLRAGALRALRQSARWRTLLLLGGLFALVAGLAQLLWGAAWMPWLAVALGAGLVTAPRLGPERLMRLAGARPLPSRVGRELWGLVATLSDRAGLDAVPALYHLPHPVPNAFAVGRRDASAIALSTGLLRTLRPAELAGVLAHEIAHIRSGDVQMMLLADLASRLTQAFAVAGMVLALVNVPLFLLGEATTSWLLIAALVWSPTASLMLQLALSRARERDADLVAARLTGDPRALASALHKIGTFHTTLLDTVLFRRRAPRPPQASPWFRSHPENRERIETLLAIEHASPGGTR